MSESSRPLGTELITKPYPITRGRGGKCSPATCLEEGRAVWGKQRSMRTIGCSLLILFKFDLVKFRKCSVYPRVYVFSICRGLGSVKTGHIRLLS